MKTSRFNSCDVAQPQYLQLPRCQLARPLPANTYPVGIRSKLAFHLPVRGLSRLALHGRRMKSGRPMLKILVFPLKVSPLPQFLFFFLFSGMS